MKRTKQLARGFTLIEVLVAVAILGVGFSAIFVSQYVSFAKIKHTRYVNESTGLARCKMSEIEWDLQQNGYQVTDVNEKGPCCEGAESSELQCAWTVATVKFPEAKFGKLDLDTDLDLGGSPGGPSVLSSLSGPGAGTGPGAAAMGFLKTGAATMQKGGDLSGIADSFLSGSDGAKDGISALLMQIVYPDVKAIFEAGTRKITVTVTWFEGREQHTNTIEQWVTSSKDAGIGANVNGLITTEEEEDTPPPPKK